MPAKTRKPTNNSNKRPAAKSSAKNKKAADNGAASAGSQRRSAASEVLNSIVPYLLFCLAVFIAVCYLFEGAAGIVGHALRKGFFGLFAGGAFAVPVFIVIIALYWRGDFERMMVRYKLLFSFVCLLFISVLLHVFTHTSDTISPQVLWEEGNSLSGGGAVGGIAGGLLLRGFGFAGALIISISALVIFGLFLFGLTPRAAWIWCAFKMRRLKERRAELAAEREQIEKRTRPLLTAVEEELPADIGEDNAVEERAAADAPRKNFNPDVPVDGEDAAASPKEPDGDYIDSGAFDEVLRKTNEGYYIINQQEPQPETPDEEAENGEKIRGLKRFKTAGKKKVPGFGGEGGNSVSADIPRRPDGSIDLEAVFAGEDSPPILAADLTDGDEDGMHAELDMEISAAELAVERKKLTAEDTDKQDSGKEAAKEEAAKPAPPARPYVLPPVSLLTIERMPENTDVREELQTTAKKLVDTLTSFKVRTRIVNVSRGPTITRYELAPEEGIRVRSISNLVDDIALNLATSGVRIEAPIPGKSAVGIEVPNRIVATVHLRELIENQRFRASQSKITVSLGMDVAGEPIYVDIAKMPHLLIAGATGMGKSVCINSMIVSLLYKSTPDEVKLILIDPKKVELNVYNGLPHLLVPVVSDPKRAAGSLLWAVTEMERRFELIETAGVRDIKSYNAVAANDPEREKLPQIVIIIDELADLMMTARDDVEESICRLAQKARASGMHLIIGTQRPSVDVITGLIKANIPSRIAFTVASQVDSRTIIDITGAEKLIGRGDMLYAPVGTAKPVRVQGSYVSESEIEAITSFIKNQDIEASYDSEVIDKIDAAAAQCGSTRKSGALSEEEESSENDPMLKPAIELALESNKISTSLIQRRLSLGYGRAAKIIDKMERIGIVSPPEGQKPRNVLITRQQYMEMVLNSDVLE